MLSRRVLAQSDLLQTAPERAALALITECAVTGVCSPSCPSDKAPDAGKGACLQGRAEGLPEGLFAGK